MKNIYKLKLVVPLAVLVLSGSCTKDFIKMNTNPNSPTAVPASNVLGQGIISVAGTLFGTKMDLYYAGSYSGMSASLGAGNGDYEYRVDINNGWWNGLYTCMNDFVDADSIARKDGNANLEAVALTMKAYTAQAATDMFGAIPYSEAFKAENITYPKYDSQQDVYKALFAELKTAADLFNAGNGDIGTGDFIFHGDVTKWKKFCNSIRLRAAIRISDVDPATAKSVISEVLGDPASYPVMTDNDDNAYLYYPGGTPDQELWYEDPQVGNETWGWYRLNDVLISTLKNTGDPRLPIYALPNKDGKYNGYKFGPDQRSDPMNTSNYLSRIGDRFANDPKGFSPFMNCAEVYFMLAEAYERGMVSGDAQEAYENGVRKSMEENGISTTATGNFLALPGVAWNSGAATNLEKIYLQKWVSLFKQSIEAWCVARRTDVPLMTNISQDYAKSHNRPPFRFPYPNAEKSLNTNFPADVKSVDIFWGDQVWWDTRKNVH